MEVSFFGAGDCLDFPAGVVQLWNVGPHCMSEEFSKLCNDVLRGAKFITSYEECCRHFQRVLDYIGGHPEEREEIIEILSQHVTDGGYTEVALAEFLMSSLKWPEIRIVAEARCAKEGNMYQEVKRLVDIYGPAA